MGPSSSLMAPERLREIHTPDFACVCSPCAALARPNAATAHPPAPAPPRAAEVVAAGRITAVERPATAFGMPWVLRTAGSSNPVGGPRAWQGGQQQQQRGYMSSAQPHRRGQPDPLVFKPPAPPFETTYQTAMVQVGDGRPTALTSLATATMSH